MFLSDASKKCSGPIIGSWDRRQGDRRLDSNPGKAWWGPKLRQGKSIRRRGERFKWDLRGRINRIYRRIKDEGKSERNVWKERRNQRWSPPPRQDWLCNLWSPVQSEIVQKLLGVSRQQQLSIKQSMGRFWSGVHSTAQVTRLWSWPRS